MKGDEAVQQWETWRGAGRPAPRRLNISRAQAARRPAAHSARGQAFRPERGGKKPARRKKRAGLAKYLAAAVCLVCAAGLLWSGGRALLSTFSFGDVGGGGGVAALVQAKKEGPPYTVAIDPGHGGIDRGAEYYAVESDVTEQTADALFALLEADENYTPVRTRQNGEGMSVAGRAESADRQGAELFLSIHFNYDETYTAYGFECYPQTPGSEYYDDAMRFANLIAQGMGDQGQRLRGEAGVRYIYYEDNGDGTYTKVLREASDTAVYDAQTFGVLEYVHCPAVLAEQCFLTSESDTAAWASAEGCQRAARVYYEAICAYFGTQPLT